MYLRMKLNRWSNLEAQIGRLRIPVKVGNSLGYMEVYNDLDSLYKDYPQEKHYIKIEEVNNEKD